MDSELIDEVRAHDAVEQSGLGSIEQRRLHIVALGVAAVSGAVWWWFFRGWIYDDSFIIYRYAQHLSDGEGLSWNVGEGGQLGSTSILWVVFGAVGSLVGVAPETSMPLLGVGAWLGVVAGVMPRVFGLVTSSFWSAVVGVSAVAALPSMGLHSHTGLETLMATVVVAAALWAAGARRWPVLAGLTLVAVLTRPDILLPVGVMWLVVLASEGRTGLRRVLPWALVAAGAVLLWAALSWWWFDTPVPNSFYVKAPAGGKGIAYVRSFVPLVLPLALPVAVALVRAPRRTLGDRWVWLAGLPALALTLAYVRTNPLLGQQWRFFVSVLPLFVVTAVRGTELIGRGVLAKASLGIAVTLSLGLQIRSFANEREDLESYFGAIQQATIPLGEAFASADPGATLATGDAGAMPYLSRLATLDVIGLNDLDIARNGLTVEEVMEFDPTIVVLQDLDALPGDGRFPVDTGTSPTSAHLDESAYVTARQGTGAGATLVVASQPGFGERYALVGVVPFRSTDEYAVFVRRDRLAENDELIRRVRSIPAARATLLAE